MYIYKNIANGAYLVFSCRAILLRTVKLLHPHSYFFLTFKPLNMYGVQNWTQLPTNSQSNTNLILLFGTGLKACYPLLSLKKHPISSGISRVREPNERINGSKLMATKHWHTHTYWKGCIYLKCLTAKKTQIKTEHLTAPSTTWICIFFNTVDWKCYYCLKLS